MVLSSKQSRVLQAIFAEPTPANIEWDEIVSLFQALGADCKKGSGSRLRVALGNRRATFHRPHPRKEAGRLMVKSVRRFLEEAGVKP